MNWPLAADIATIATCLIAAILIVPVRRHGIALGMGATFVASAVWALGHAIAATATSAGLGMFGLVLGVAGSAFGGATVIVVAYRYSHPTITVPRWAVVALITMPTAVTLLAATQPLHHAYWQTVNLFASTGTTTVTTSGPLQTLAISFYGSITLGWALTLFLGAGARGSRELRLQSWAVMLVSLAPGITLGIQRLAAPSLFGPYSPSTVVIFSALGIAFIAVRLRLFELTPAVVEEFLQHMPLGLIILDVESRIIDMNTTAVGLTAPVNTPTTAARPGKTTLWRGSGELTRLSELLGDWDGAGEDRLNLLLHGNPILIARDGRYLSVRLWSHSGSAGNTIGRAVLIEDVSEEYTGLARLTELSGSLERWSEEVEAFQTILADARVEAQRH